ncbi:MAG: flagellar basal body-associated FliL family protein [Rubrivivax sp.]|jgi:flagellar FliL protein
MSSAAATADAVPPKKGNKKLIIIGAAVAALVLGGGGAAFMMMKSKAAAEAEAEESADGEDGGSGKGSAKAKDAKKFDPKAVPTFTPLEMFTVNLADREVERYAQVGITLEMSDVAAGDRLKNFMPAVRNQILLALGDRKADELSSREGKLALALRIKLDTSRVLGAEFDDADFGLGADAATEAKPGDEAEEDTKAKKKTKAKKAKAAPELPVLAVHFSNFIIQ